MVLPQLTSNTSDVLVHELAIIDRNRAIVITLGKLMSRLEEEIELMLIVITLLLAWDK